MKPNWTPHPYQFRGIEFMVSRGVAGMFLDPGLGKTSITLAAFKVLKEQKMVSRMLVIAPLRVCQFVWPQEVAKWAEFEGLRVSVLHGPEKELAARADADVFVINPEGIWSGRGGWYFDYAHKYVKPDMLVIDESTRFKNSQSKRFMELRKHLDSFRRRYILTGTPMPNGMEDLFAQIYLLDRGAALGPYITHFRKQHFIPDHFGHTWTLKEGHADIIYDSIAPFCLRMSGEEYLELPELVRQEVKFELPKKAREAYDKLETEFIAELDEGELTALSTATVSMKLRQICNGGAYMEDGDVAHTHDAKVDALAELVQEAQTPVLCAYQFKHDLDRIREKLGEVPHIGGGVNKSRANSLINSFNDGDVPLLLAHTASVGHGLNLQGSSNHVAFFGLPWSLEEYDQFIQRVLRQGNPHKRVFVHVLIAADTVEEGMVQAIAAKDRTQSTMLKTLRDYYKESLS